MDIAVDFDGTVVFHRYPAVGEDIPGAAETLRKLQDQGHNLILFTMRSKQELVDAVKWFYDHGLRLYSVNTNPTQLGWTDSPKVHAQLYIDDHGVNCPTGIETESGVARLFVDWEKINQILIDSGFLVE